MIVPNVLGSNVVQESRKSRESQEILAAAKACYDFDDIGIINYDMVFFVVYFNCYEDEEPHDVAWNELMSIQDYLAPAGLIVVDSGSDNDSLWGRVVRYQEKKAMGDESESRPLKGIRVKAPV